MVTSVTEGGAQKLPKKNLRLSKPTDMTIHWKSLEEHLKRLVPKRYKSIFVYFGSKTL
jgi:hypothetical protein